MPTQFAENNCNSIQNRFTSQCLENPNYLVIFSIKRHHIEKLDLACPTFTFCETLNSEKK